MAETRPDSPPAAILLNQVDKGFGEGEARVQVLHQLDLQLPAGELILLVGPSGCGKTTLISVIAGILNADGGTVEVLGQPIHRFNDGQKTAFRKENVGFIFQQFNLIPTLTVRENVAVPLMIQKWPIEAALLRATEVLDSVGLANRADFLPANLSGGQQQRVAIARALVRDPKLMICDEPTASLDGQTGGAIMKMLREVAVQPGRCVIVVTHDNRIYPYGDRMVRMEDGTIQGIESLRNSVN